MTRTAVAPRPVISRLSPIALLRSGGTILGFVILIVAFSALRPTTFLTANNFLNILEQSAILAIVATVQTVVMVVNDFDLSVGAMASLAGSVVATLMVGGTPIPLAIVIALAVGALVGLINGFLVGYVGFSAFVATLAVLTTTSGASYLVVGGTTVFGLPTEFAAFGSTRVLGILPAPVLVLAAVAIIVAIVLSRTTFGRRLYAVGGNPDVASLSGVNVPAVRLAAFVVAGVGAALAGVVLTSHLATAAAAQGDSLMLTSIAAVFLGMTMFKSGLPNIPGTLVGVAILGVLSNGLNILQVSTYVQQVVTGIIIALAVLLSRLDKRRRS